MTYILLASTVCFAVLYAHAACRLEYSRAIVRDLCRRLWTIQVVEPDTLRSVSPPPSPGQSATPDQHP